MTTTEIEKEIEYLENKKGNYGWTQSDVILYEYLVKLLNT